MTVDELAQLIRQVDGNHSLGAGALAEKLMPAIEAAWVASASVQSGYGQFPNAKAACDYYYPLVVDMSQRLADLTAERVPQEVQIKPLEWVKDEQEYNHHSAENEALSLGYEIRENIRGEVRVRFVRMGWVSFPGSVDEAKAAGQQDYEQRIRSAIVMPAQQSKESGQ